ncbi:MAG: amino acid-binding protein [Clostridia bacterium]|nr:amino acid-binding protein [Clostridia bacterium]MBQ4157676.1 amino acid-binding protein [Clostridia bacterium]
MYRVKQLSAFLENRKGSLAAVTQLLGANGLNLLALSIAETDNFGVCRFILSDYEAGMKQLRSAGYTVRTTDVLVTCVPDRPSGLGDILRLMEKEDISVEYLYSFVRNSGFNALIIFRVSDIDKAQRVFKENRIEMLTQAQVEAL